MNLIKVCKRKSKKEGEGGGERRKGGERDEVGKILS